jgi:uncharacterized protein
MKENEKAIEITKKWIETFVLGLNLCPFARHPYKYDKIRYVIFEGNDVTVLTDLITTEMALLDDTSPAILETTVIIAMNGFSDFEDYLSALYDADALLEELDYEGVYQIASFHPDYKFEGSESEDVTNYTNRSPYPMFHLLREDSVTRALDAFPEVGDILAQNQETMTKLGLTKVKKMLDDVRKEAL